MHPSAVGKVGTVFFTLPVLSCKFHLMVQAVVFKALGMTFQVPSLEANAGKDVAGDNKGPE